MSEDIVILGGARTAIGTFGGALAATPPIALATQVTKAAMARAGVEPGQIGNVVFGHVINTEPRDMYLSRAAAIEAGVFGSPFFIIDGEPFWGADRLWMVKRWLKSGGW